MRQKKIRFTALLQKLAVTKDEFWKMYDERTVLDDPRYWEINHRPETTSYLIFKKNGDTAEHMAYELPATHDAIMKAVITIVLYEHLDKNGYIPESTVAYLLEDTGAIAKSRENFKHYHPLVKNTVTITNWPALSSRRRMWRYVRVRKSEYLQQIDSIRQNILNLQDDDMCPHFLTKKQAGQVQCRCCDKILKPKSK